MLPSTDNFSENMTSPVPKSSKLTRPSFPALPIIFPSGLHLALFMCSVYQYIEHYSTNSIKGNLANHSRVFSQKL